ncbi:ankyrin repeat-containing protein BDA1-like [Durio zibethinus]|uniref:Ankyrin repeat-containing protein BDA1-like n=1 Tax=Durio zibethinus TaxID=66656 RepID=A0A6P5XRU4_DURZI|nr:ankyrin repeat-containing protein BDA1-like [Durio zibethinus]
MNTKCKLIRKMERKLYDAAVEGSVISLRNLLQGDALLLDRFITGHYSETPLHVASMLGHLEFVDEILARKPELAKELDSRQSSPLHLATAKGYLDIVKRLLQVNPDMCHVCNLDGRNPLHIAAIKGKLDVLRELVQARPSAAWLLMDEGETILHACVRHNQLEAMKFLVERVSDHDFVNCKNYDGNTILHLAIAAKQIEAINFLISSTTVDVNCRNADGFTVMDLLSQNQRAVIDKEIIESLRRMGAVHAKHKPLSTCQLKSARIKILTSPSTSNTVSKPMKSKDRKKFVNRNADWLERKRNTLMLVASLLATMAFQAGVNPPSAVWQDTSPSGSSSTASNDSNESHHKAGSSIMADNYPFLYTSFLISNTTGFLASLSIILLLISGLPLRRRFFMWVLMVIMWVAITAMAFAYLVSIAAFTPEKANSLLLRIIVIAVLVWISLMLLLLLGHTIRLIIRLIKYLRKLVIRLINVISTRGPGG